MDGRAPLWEHQSTTRRIPALEVATTEAAMYLIAMAASLSRRPKLKTLLLHVSLRKLLPL